MKFSELKFFELKFYAHEENPLKDNKIFMKDSTIVQKIGTYRSNYEASRVYDLCN